MKYFKELDRNIWLIYIENINPHMFCTGLFYPTKIGTVYF